MKLFEATDVDAIDLLVDLIDPLLEITGDAEVVACLRTNQRLKGIKFMMKKHPKAILKMLAVCEGVPVEEYHPTALQIPGKLIEVLNHPEFSRLFTTQARTDSPNSMPATETTQGEGN